MTTESFFFLPPEKWGAHSALEQGELHHLSRVLHLMAGSVVTCFDGRGRVGRFTLTSITKKKALLQLEEERFVPRPPIRLTLALAWTKALRRSWILEKSAELGVHALWFWQAERSQGVLPDEIKPTWAGPLVAGAKQSKNSWLPEVRMLSGGFPALVAEGTHFDHAFALNAPLGTVPLRPEQVVPGDHLAVIGPEGGFSPNEEMVLASGALRTYSLGTRFLRWETAALVIGGIYFWAETLFGRASASIS